MIFTCRWEIIPIATSHDLVTNWNGSFVEFNSGWPPSFMESGLPRLLGGQSCDPGFPVAGGTPKGRDEADGRRFAGAQFSDPDRRGHVGQEPSAGPRLASRIRSADPAHAAAEAVHRAAGPPAPAVARPAPSRFPQPVAWQRVGLEKTEKSGLNTFTHQIGKLSVQRCTQRCQCRGSTSFRKGLWTRTTPGGQESHDTVLVGSERGNHSRHSSPGIRA